MKESCTNKRSKLLILDADVVLNVFALGEWDKFIESHSVILSETVIGEAEYIEDPETLQRTYLKLDGYAKAGRIRKISVDVSDTLTMENELQKLNTPIIHAGERESLAFLYLNNDENLMFCTADKAPTICAVCLGFESNLISLQRALSLAQISASVRYQFTEEVLQESIAQGHRHLIENFSAK